MNNIYCKLGNPELFYKGTPKNSILGLQGQIFLISCKHQKVWKDPFSPPSQQYFISFYSRHRLKEALAFAEKSFVEGSTIQETATTKRSKKWFFYLFIMY